MLTTRPAALARIVRPSARTKLKSSSRITYGPPEPFDTATWITLYSCSCIGRWAHMTVTPERVSVWYFSPFDSNAMTWAAAGKMQATTNVRTHSSRLIFPYYDSTTERDGDCMPTETKPNTPAAPTSGGLEAHGIHNI